MLFVARLTTVAIERFGEYRGRVTASEMTNIESAMLCSLDLYLTAPETQVIDPNPELIQKLNEAETKFAVLQQMYDSLLGRVVKA